MFSTDPILTWERAYGRERVFAIIGGGTEVGIEVAGEAVVGVRLEPHVDEEALLLVQTLHELETGDGEDEIVEPLDDESVFEQRESLDDGHQDFPQRLDVLDRPQRSQDSQSSERGQIHSAFSRQKHRQPARNHDYQVHKVPIVLQISRFTEYQPHTHYLQKHFYCVKKYKKVFHI